MMCSRRVLAVGLYCAFAAAYAQSAPVPVKATANAAKPASTPAHDSYWLERASFFDAFRTTASVVMLGDSLTDGAEWREMFPDVAIVNRGIDGDTTGGILERMDGIVSLHAGKAFVMIGINDFTETGSSVEAVFRNYRKIVAALKQSGAKVFVQSTLMCNERKALQKACGAANAKVRRLNQRLAALAPEEFTFIDINRKLSGAEGLRSELTYDGIHLNGNGYLLWRDEISPFIVATQSP